MLVNWAVRALLFWLTAKIVPGFRLSGVWNSIVVAAIFGILSFLLGTILYWAIGLLTLGIGFIWIFSFLAHLVVNAILIKLTDAFSSRLHVDSFGTAFLGALVMTGLLHVGMWLLGRGPNHALPGTIVL